MTEHVGSESSESRPSLAPEPDFRHVSLAARVAARAPGSWSLAGAGLASVVGLGPTLGWREATFAGAAFGVSALFAALRARRVRVRAFRALGRPVAMSIVPWGVIVDEGAQTRVLRWSAVAHVEVETLYGRDQATDVTKGSTVVVETAQERLLGLAHDAVPLERLLAHREAYAREAAHVAAMDLDGNRAAGEPWEPQAEKLLLASGQMLRGGGGGDGGFATSVLGYRGRRATLASEEVATRLRAILRDRTDRALDPRPLGVILAAELGLVSLAPDVAQLVASPHPLTAAAARAAGIALGLPKSRLGVLDEVAPFLPDGDIEALAAWSALRAGDRAS